MKKNGFTLIELLIVISIIAILTTLGLSVYQGIQTRGKDSIKKNALNQLATALELYFQKNGRYIVDTSGGIITDIKSCPLATATTSIFYNEINGIAPYLSGTVPKDPLTGTLYCYISVDSGQGFRLFAKLDSCSDPQIISGTCSSTYNYSITSENLSITPAP